ncbi:uncharacterized protein [Rutidosis leptorrhynchoides]|uniref:uncharacterized protein n=1 Tax=Rutidosis leptorrhynchoides TaxID=125765 RepID=UPI003A98E8B1
MSAYCQEIKNITDQLSNVGPKVEEDRLVLQLVTGLNESYDSIASQINHMAKLPTFYEARSKLILEESRKSKQASQSSPASSTALLSVTPPTPVRPPAPSNTNQRNTGQFNRGRNSNQGNYRGRGGFGRGHGGCSYSGTHPTSLGPYSANGFYSPYGPYWQAPNWVQQQPNWNSPPCSYPTTVWPRPNSSPGQAGLLGPRPHHPAYAQSATSNTPTDIESAMYTMSLNLPEDNNWYMDTGASSHMSGSQGKLLSYFHSGHPKYILVGNGNRLPINGFGHSFISSTQKPLLLSNILYAPQLITNLISIRRLTTENHVSITFDPFGFTVKDFLKGTTILRCNSTGDLYPLHSSMLHQLSYPLTFIALSQDLWHHRLGHPGADVLKSL